ncbi:unnamed protein product [Caenorhabditis auriculariae]|uniref:non-specific serine/threonine protein kinase n=1 Tax=Caenorhabditis auriculariae TaxID=2777116 RepID=A0A8S1GXE0_9PELO|nr:unnamed protein product [Caenorhabditis auriculariae]
MTLPILAKKVKKLASSQLFNLKLLLNGESSRGFSKFKKTYKLKGELGRGGFGIVYRAVRVADDVPVAVKFIDRMSVKEWGRVNGEQVPMEICMLMRCSKVRGVIRLLDWYSIPEGFLIVMERPYPCVDMFDFVKGQQKLDEETARFLFRQITHTIQECSQNRVLHRDIKDENVVIDLVTGETRLIDFGASTILKKSHYSDFQGTRLYCPPEWFLHSLYLGREAAVWSLGVLLYNALNGRLPFRNEKDICTAHLLGPLPFYVSVSAEAKDLISKCLAFDPFARCSLDAILNHPWLRKPTSDWTTLTAKVSAGVAAKDAAVETSTSAPSDEAGSSEVLEEVGEEEKEDFVSAESEGESGVGSLASTTKHSQHEAMPIGPVRVSKTSLLVPPSSMELKAVVQQAKTKSSSQCNGVTSALRPHHRRPAQAPNFTVLTALRRAMSRERQKRAGDDRAADKSSGAADQWSDMRLLLRLLLVAAAVAAAAEPPINATVQVNQTQAPEVVVPKIARDQGSLLITTFPAVTKIRPKKKNSRLNNREEPNVEKSRGLSAFEEKKIATGSSYSLYLSKPHTAITGDPYANGYRGKPDSQIGQNGANMGGITRSGNSKRTFGSYGSVDSQKGQASMNRATGSSYGNSDGGYGSYEGNHAQNWNNGNNNNNYNGYSSNNENNNQNYNNGNGYGDQNGWTSPNSNSGGDWNNQGYGGSSGDEYGSQQGKSSSYGDYGNAGTSGNFGSGQSNTGGGYGDSNGGYGSSSGNEYESNQRGNGGYSSGYGTSEDGYSNAGGNTQGGQNWWPETSNSNDNNENSNQNYAGSNQGYGQNSYGGQGEGSNYGQQPSSSNYGGSYGDGSSGSNYGGSNAGYGQSGPYGGSDSNQGQSTTNQENGGWGQTNSNYGSNNDNSPQGGWGQSSSQPDWGSSSQYGNSQQPYGQTQNGYGSDTDGGQQNGWGSSSQYGNSQQPYGQGQNQNNYGSDNDNSQQGGWGQASSSSQYGSQQPYGQTSSQPDWGSSSTSSQYGSQQPYGQTQNQNNYGTNENDNSQWGQSNSNYGSNTNDNSQQAGSGSSPDWGSSSQYGSSNQQGQNGWTNNNYNTDYGNQPSGSSYGTSDYGGYQPDSSQSYGAQNSGYGDQNGYYGSGPVANTGFNVAPQPSYVSGPNYGVDMSLEYGGGGGYGSNKGKKSKVSLALTGDHEEYEKLSLIYRVILFAASIVHFSAEIIRLVLAFYGNLFEKMSALSGFLITSAVIQLPITIFLLVNTAFRQLPIEIVLFTLIIGFNVFQIVTGTMTIKRIADHQMKAFAKLIASQTQLTAPTESNVQ